MTSSPPRSCIAVFAVRVCVCVCPRVRDRPIHDWDLSALTDPVHTGTMDVVSVGGEGARARFACTHTCINLHMKTHTGICTHASTHVRTHLTRMGAEAWVTWNFFAVLDGAVRRPQIRDVQSRRVQLNGPASTHEHQAVARTQGPGTHGHEWHACAVRAHAHASTRPGALTHAAASPRGAQ